MNERIQQLAEQAGLTTVADVYLMKKYMPNEVKFAELIVQEMCEVMKAESEGFDLCSNFGAVQGIDVCMRKVKTHFGVEE